MTKVDVIYGENRLKVTAKGHATGDERVCAAVSSLFYALAGYVKNECRVIYSFRLDKGDAGIECKCSKKMDPAIELFLIGLRQIEREYPHLLCVVTGK